MYVVKATETIDSHHERCLKTIFRGRFTLVFKFDPNVVSKTLDREQWVYLLVCLDASFLLLWDALLCGRWRFVV